MRKTDVSYYKREVCDTIDATFSYANLQYGVEDHGKPLTVEPFNFDGIDMMYFFMALEKRFGTHFEIPVEDKYCFYTIDAIAKQLSILEPPVSVKNEVLTPDL